MAGPQTHHQQVEIHWSTVIRVHWILLEISMNEPVPWLQMLTGNGD